MSKEKLTPEEELRIQNEIEALKLEMDHDATTFIADDAPPEIIEQWLKQINEFETLNKNGELISIQAYIGAPASFKNVEEISEKEAKAAISKIEKLIEKKSIIIKRPDHLTDMGWYDFLVTDFLPQEIVNFSAPNYVHRMNYDDFRHDSTTYIIEHAQDVIEDIIDLSNPYDGIWLADRCRSNQKRVPKSKVIETVNAFRAQYEDIDLFSFAIDSIRQEASTIFLLFIIKWSGTRAKTGKIEDNEGKGFCQMIFDGEEWVVEAIIMPGFKF